MDTGVGHSLTSCTTTINTFRLPSAVKGPLGSLGDTKVVLVDTPGFDDTNKPDCQIFEMVAEWLKNVSVTALFLRRYIVLMYFIRPLSRLGIAGLIYLHRISDNRMAGTPQKNLYMFSKLRGKKLMTNVAFITTMWGDTAEVEGVRREAELEGRYFREYILLGATLARFDDSQVSAAAILEPLVTSWRARRDEDRVLSIARLQVEGIAYHLEIPEASLDRVVTSKVQTNFKRRQELVDELVAQIEANKDDTELLQRIMGEMKHLQVELEEVYKDADRLHLEFAPHLQLYVTEMARTPHPMVTLVRSLFLRFARS